MATISMYMAGPLEIMKAFERGGVLDLDGGFPKFSKTLTGVIHSTPTGAYVKYKDRIMTKAQFFPSLPSMLEMHIALHMSDRHVIHH